MTRPEGSDSHFDHGSDDVAHLAEAGDLVQTLIRVPSRTGADFDTPTARVYLHQHIRDGQNFYHSEMINPIYESDAGPSPSFSFDSVVSSTRTGTASPVRTGEISMVTRATPNLEASNFEASQRLLKFYIDKVAPWV